MADPTFSGNIQEAFDQVAIDVAAIEQILTGQTTSTPKTGTNTPVPEIIYPVQPVTLQPPDPATPLPEAQRTYPANPLKASTPVDLRLACHGFNHFDLLLTDDFDFLTDPELHTAIVISLFTDRYDPELGQGGWWGDGSADADFLMGSRLWRLRKSKVTSEALRTAEDYARESLQWLIDDNLITELEVAARWQYADQKHQMQLAVVASPDPSGVYGSQHYQQNFIVI